MPRRDDLKKILIIGSGPIVIGQACEFDYSGTQACKALREEGYEVVLLNSNPATIMTDPGLADRTYVEPITPEIAERILERERPQALLPTLGGQTALNLAVELGRRGALERHGVELIGASLVAIEKAEDREQFKAAMEKIGLSLPVSGFARSVDEAMALGEKVGFPTILRPSFTLGGQGGGIAYNREELRQKAEVALRLSPTHQVLVEQSVLGWKEFELEVMRDRADNALIVCSIENLDPMGVHTGDSITVAPAQTLTDKEYQRLRDYSLAIIREIGVSTGGSNIQFAVNPDDGRVVVVEMNPRVSRSSALASKATGFPIAKIAAKLAVGYTLDELRNDITRETPASFEPSIDYVVVKLPRFAFEKFPKADATLTTQMKSVGEAMAIGRTFREAMGKALRSLENDRSGLTPWQADAQALTEDGRAALAQRLRVPSADRLWQLGDAVRRGVTPDELHEITGIDRWFLRELREIVRLEGRVAEAGAGLTPELLRQAKEEGLSDRRLAELTGQDEGSVRERRQADGIVPVYKRVDTCAAEFRAHTPYLYSTYEAECEAEPTDRRKVMILGSGPNRIGQGLEFDTCCVQASYALRRAGFETLMVNCNPETVSTDYDTSDRLYFEPLTLEDVLAIHDRERPVGVVVQLGGQTPLKLAHALADAGVKILGTSPEAIDRAEDRERFAELLTKLGLRQAAHGLARTPDEAREAARRLGFPVMVRPSYVLGGRAMEVCRDEAALEGYLAEAFRASAERPVLVDRFLSDATEIDVDAISDGVDVYVAGVMEHIEEAGIHSGDSACALPPFGLTPKAVAEIEAQTVALARELGVVGLMNVQYALHRGELYVLEVNPRASRTVPFVSKATGVRVAEVAALCLVGQRLAQALPGRRSWRTPHVSVKAPVFPFSRFPGVDTILGPEMRSTGEVMGIDRDFPRACAKAQLAAGNALPLEGRAFLSVKDDDKPAAVQLGRRLVRLGFTLCATGGTAAALERAGVAAVRVQKVAEGRPHVVDKIVDGEVDIVFNTTVGRQSILDSYSIRRETLMHGIPYCVTLEAALAAVDAIEALQKGPMDVTALQDFHEAERSR
ncbi:MAG: carbamoyl-phosphate synthase large subunit [Deltaproteobacteria bacterium]